MNDLMPAVDFLAVGRPFLAAWMNWLAIVFLFSVFFMIKHKAARLVFFSLFLLLPLSIFIFERTNNVNMISLAHLLVGPPLAYFLVQQEIRTPHFKGKSFYGVWLILLVATIIVSLLFDARDFVLVLMGVK